MFGKFMVRLVKCDDLEAMTTFYRDKLGLAVTNDHSPEWIAFDDGIGGEFVLGKASPIGEATVTLAFTGSPDLAAARQALLDEAPTEIAGHDTGKSFWVQDPDGNYVGFAD